MEENKELKLAKQNKNLITKKHLSGLFFQKKNFRFDYTVIKIISSIILAILYSIIKIYRMKKPRICLCTVGKKENLYVKEFVNYYKQLGYSHIYIYDNNDIDGEKFEDVLQEELQSNFVSIINFRGKIGKQCLVYEDCYEKNNKNYEWLSFFDFDEFLDIKPYANTIQEFLSNKRYKKCITIKINFLFYSDNELLYYDNRTLQERFTTALPKHGNNYFIKTTVRGGLYPNYWSVTCGIHSSAYKCYSCNANGEKVDYKTGGILPKFKYARLKHYYTKSTEEYANKCKRGSASGAVKWNEKRKKFKYNLYFVYNKRTKEKEELLRKVLNMTNSTNETNMTMTNKTL